MCIFGIFTLLLCVSGFRYNVGADYMSYYSNYNYYKNSEFDLLTENEIGIRIIAHISKYLLDIPETMIFLCSFITILFFLKCIKSTSDDIVLSVFLYVFLGMFIGSFNAIRQYLGVAIVFWGIRYVLNKEFIKWCLCIIMAFLCHTSALFVLPIYFLVRIKSKKKFFLIAVLISVVAYFSYDKLFAMIDIMKGYDSGSVADRIYATNSVSIFRVLMSWVPFVLCCFPKNILDEKLPEKDQILINYTFLIACLQTVSMNSTYLARFCTYTTAVNIITIPCILKHQSKNNHKVLYWLLLIIYLLYWTAEATGPYVVNYQWIFSKG